jgi:hypothetical protein
MRHHDGRSRTVRRGRVRMVDNLCYLTVAARRPEVHSPAASKGQRPAASRNSNLTAGPPLPRIGAVSAACETPWRHDVYARSRRGPPVPSTVAAMARRHRRARPNATSTPDTRAALLPYVRPPRAVARPTASWSGCRSPRHVAAHPHPRRRGLEHARSREVRRALRRPEPSRADRGQISEPHPNRKPRNPAARPRV